VCPPCPFLSTAAGTGQTARTDGLKDLQLSKEDEASAEDTEVRREDQEKINRFSRLHAREAVLEEQLKAKQVCFLFLSPFDSLVLLLHLAFFLVPWWGHVENLNDIYIYNILFYSTPRGKKEKERRLTLPRKTRKTSRRSPPSSSSPMKTS